MEKVMSLIDQANVFLTEQFGELGPLLVIGVLGMFLILLTLPILLKKQKDPFDQIRAAARGVADTSEDGPKLRRGRGRGGDKLEKYSNFLDPQDEQQYSDIKLKLLQAGYRSKDAVRTYHFLQFLLGVLFLLVGIGYAIFASTTGEPTTQSLIISVVLPGLRPTTRASMTVS